MFASSGVVVVVVIDAGRRACADVDLDVTSVGGRAGGGIGSVAVRSGVDAAAIDVEGRASGGGGGGVVNVSVVGRRAGGGVDAEVSRQTGA